MSNSAQCEIQGRRCKGSLTSLDSRWYAYNSELQWKLKPPSALGYLITAKFRTLRVFPMQVLASSCLPQQILNFQISSPTSMKKLQNSLELPNPTKNTRKFAKKIITDTSGEINSQSKQDIICHVAKVKPATSAHYVADVIPFFSVHNIPFESNALIKPEKCFPHTVKKK